MSDDLKIINLVYLGGLIWLFVHIYIGINITICPLKLFYGIPCPACGTTRGIMLIMQGRIIDGIYANPNVIITFPILVLYPIIKIYDYFFKKNSLQNIYSIVENILKRKKIFIPLIIIEIIIWFLNIYNKR